ncbi:hypothetical protein O4H49_06040 [Kiloniella laminariae]|uniref:Lipoprotein n=1 Tax=Kiloniella laminariae TaxID=454162 RepID=A0ABT4LGU5_9PROT|nr:hypothetical protein [Kiloniella laminariae]MCZ4280328.1 hypothetical protein [Kiloniella laminariae]
MRIVEFCTPFYFAVHPAFNLSFPDKYLPRLLPIMKKSFLVPLVAFLLSSCVTQNSGQNTSVSKLSCDGLIASGSRLESDISKLNKAVRCAPSELKDGTQAAVLKASGKMKPSFSPDDLTPYAHRLSVTIGKLEAPSSVFSANISEMAQGYAEEFGGKVLSVGEKISHPSGYLESATLLAIERSAHNIQIACVVAIRTKDNQGFLTICRDAGLEGDTVAADAVIQEIIRLDVPAIRL